MESADRVKSFATAALVLMAILALVLALNKLVPLLWISRSLFRAGVGRTPVDIGQAFLVLLAPIALVVIAVCFSCFQEAIVERICRPIGNIPATWEPAAFRVAFIFAGVLVLSWAVYNLAGAGERIVQLVYDDVPQGWEPLAWDGLWVSLASGLSKLVIGGYLLCGASAILGWQLRRIPSGTCCETEPAMGSLSDSSEIAWTGQGP